MKEKLSKLLPEYWEFRENFVSLTYSKDSTNSSNILTKYVINKLENYYSNRTINHDDASIEHIVNETEDETTHNIGNLILLEEKLNNHLVGDDFSSKKAQYEKSSYAHIKQFLNEYNEFGMSNIEERAEKLCQVYYSNIMGLEIPKENPISSIVEQILGSIGDKKISELKKNN